MALFDRNEPRHHSAKKQFEAAPTLVLHNYVLAEFVPLVSARRLPRPLAFTFLRGLLAETDLQLVWVDRALHDAGMALLERRRDKDYSLCDAVSFVLMEEFGETDALTTDHHFDQEGFTRLLE
jgi:predicted nucleic acid-binding protein